VAKLFAPEHGAFGKYDEEVRDETDSTSMLPIHSLYGEHRKPSPETLDGLDYLIFELQDVGARFYTYTATLLLAIDAAFDAGIRILILDRPNPIGGEQFGGPIADGPPYSFVAPYSIPIRHGLTLGEIACLYAAENGKKVCLEVVKMENWERALYFDQTAVPWVPPSPAMKSLSTAVVYTATCLLEQTNMSVGRGTDSPFELIGAPYINSAEWARRVNELEMPGVYVEPTPFTPIVSKFAGEKCNGLRIVVTDRQNFQSVEFGISLVSTLRDCAGGQFNIDGIQGLLANSRTLALLTSGHSSSEIPADYSQDLAQWNDRRTSAMLYPSIPSKTSPTFPPTQNLR
jgi:uncharacterized protein YbbC (DUF1343 family)